MNAPLDAGQRASLEAALNSVTLDDKYTLERGRAYMSGIQALVRLPMLQQERDKAAGLNTAGFISGYRGSPLGGLDQSLWKAKQHLAAHQVVFQPGVNEDLAATAVWGSQQVNLYPNAKFDGVFSMWYGKGPGVDRSGDVLKHGNSAGSSQHGGVLVLAGDDHAAKSSTLAHQSEHMFKACGLPVLFPSNVQEYLDFGLHGWAMSRYSGLWVAMKCVTDVVESSASVDIDPHRTKIILPEDFAMPDGGLNIRWPDPPLVQEARLLDYKWYAALAYVRANKLDRVEIDSQDARFGIMTAGKAYLDVRQALTDLGLDDETCSRIGIRLYKVGCVWPLEAQGAHAFAHGLKEILVVEEKRQILEYAIKEELYNWPDAQRPRVFGKFDEKDGAGGEWSVPMGNWLLPAHYELSPAIIAKAIATRLDKFDLPSDVRARIASRIAVIEAKEKALARPRVEVERKPWFCSGCPHNTSTNVPEGSRAMAGIGCHYMTVWMDRSTSTFSQMGGEGVAWIGQAPFTNDKHVFANLGDGTYFHSGLLAIRAAIASKANITYKILYNDAVAMTGGQPVDGVLTVPQITHQLAAEGASKIVIVTDEPEKYNANVGLAPGITIHHRDQLDDVQRALREIAGTSILIYDQTCATEKRRRRKRGTYPDPARRVVINEAVCEGCGDCSVKSNCLSVEPLDTEYGTKRQINQSTCNKDFSCVNGFCPSFVSVEGGQLRKPKASSDATTDAMPPVPAPELPSIERPYGVLVTGVGGTGVVTIGALLGMAAHLENKGVTVLDVTGLAQKGGAVMSHVQISKQPADIHATRIAMGEARLVIGCDAIVTATDECVSRMQVGRTRVVLNSARTPTAAFIKNPNWQFPGADAESDVRLGAGDAGRCDRRQPLRRRATRRCDLHEPVRARLRVAKGLGAADVRVADACDRTERGAGREEPCGLRMGPPCRARPSGGAQAHAVARAQRCHRDGRQQDHLAAHAEGARYADRQARRLPERMAKRRLRGTLSGTGGASAGGRISARRGRRSIALDRSGGEKPPQADGLQGRVRSRTPVRRSGVHRKAEGEFRGGLEGQHSPRAAGLLEEGRARSSDQKEVRTVDPQRHARACEVQVPARHGVRCVRQDGGAPRRAGADQ
jgi:indolepyruvate ferredoxin oxidoreductase